MGGTLGYNKFLKDPGILKYVRANIDKVTIIDRRRYGGEFSDPTYYCWMGLEGIGELRADPVPRFFPNIDDKIYALVNDKMIRENYRG